MLESTRHSNAARLAFRITEPPARASIEVEKQRLVVETRSHPKTPVYLLMKKKDEVFAGGPFRLSASHCNKITDPRDRDLIFMTLSKPKLRKRLCTNPARLALPTTPEKHEDVLERTDAPAWIDLLGEAKRALEVLIKVMISVFYVYGADFPRLEEL